MTTTLTNTNFEAQVTPELAAFTARTMSYEPWVAGLELLNWSRTLDITEVSKEFLRKQITLLLDWQEIDGHNWSNYSRACHLNMVELYRSLLARKA